MSDRIAQTLQKLFERHRIVFWYDVKKELRKDYEALVLEGVKKLEIQNNEYGIKHQILREEPEKNFLLYYEGAQPVGPDNWLLDVLLAHGEFRTDQVGLWLSELGLGLEFFDVVEAHADFFKAIKRKDAFKKLLQPDDTSGLLRLKMLAVCAGSDVRIDSVLENLLQELSEGRDEKYKLILRCGLADFLWQQLNRHFGYRADEPTIRDFVVELFKSCYAMGTNGQVLLNGDALVFLKRWKDSRQFESSFEALSDECAEVLGIEQDLNKRSFRELLELDYFRLVDQKIISDLVREIAGRTVSSGDVSLWSRQRRQSHWYGQYHDLYEVIDYGAQFIHTLAESALAMESLEEGVERYCRFWFRIDQLYRKFIYHVCMSGQPSLLGPLMDQIENLYSNSYLLKLGDGFQAQIDDQKAQPWKATVSLQRHFFMKWIRPFLTKGKKVCVIISDGMRYEVGDELLTLIRQEDRYSAEIDAALSMLPSYTQLGMAALLPNKQLAISDNDTGMVLVDGRSSQGLANRAKILNAGLDGKGAAAVKADELLGLDKDDCRALVREHVVLYIFHNRIDASGDKRDSEEQVFEATEKTLQDIIRIVKKLTAANASNILVTADHGFLYQNRAIEESDFSGVEVSGEVIQFRDRRFVLGKGLAESSSLHKFSSEQLGLVGDVEVQIPKSINRLRLKGSGSRYVHGGATLQETVIPVLKINKKRQSDVISVEVDILRSGSSVITSGQVAVAFYQESPVTVKVQPRTLRAGIYTEEGELISDSHDLIFDFGSESPRERELQVRFILSRSADEVNNKEVILKLTEQHAGTSHYKEYKSVRYLMRRSFTSDFDF